MKSYWTNSLSEEEKNKFNKLEQNLKTDICIIGGGLTGLSTAYYLNKYKIRTVLHEKGEICRQTSGNSTAKITSQHGLIYKYLTDSKGKDFARKYYEANEVQERMKNVLPIKALLAIRFEQQAQFNPYKYANALAKICSDSGIKIYEHTKAIDVETEDEDEYYIITLENGYKIKAKYLIIATKYPIVNIPGFYFIKMYQSTSYAIGMQTKERLFEGMYINSGEPTISLRTAKYGDEYLLIVAGFDHKTGAQIDLSNSYKYLEEVARNIYPKGKIKYHWNTEDCITLDKIPYIGEFSKLWENCYVATGFNKWGITSSNIAARIITDKILGEKNEYEEVFKATRLEPIKNIKEVTNMVKESVNSLVIKKLEIPQEAANQIQEGEGKIVEVNGQKIGIYKDKEGEIYKVDPVCKHLGCELSWNNLDKTWDCPCHGSRYDYKGNLIYGPSVKNL